MYVKANLIFGKRNEEIYLDFDLILIERLDKTQETIIAFIDFKSHKLLVVGNNEMR